jgi:hypothetical protein
MLVSDMAGAIAGLLLAIPALRDQVERYRAKRQQSADTMVPATRRLIARAIRLRKDGFSGHDTTLLAFGSLGLIVSFVLKLFGG